ncbi:DUF6022 family protein [Brevundimonas staleyi]|uniref:DUF6022 family protein n=1 Tax=Brevundimonas staleyi TaxID=74326 RepID=A0ABW0FXP6_9CAUL
MMPQRPAPAPDSLDVETLARDIQRLVDDRLAATLPSRQAEFDDRFARDGDMAYGALNTELFQPVRALLKTRGLWARPRLPGDFQESREWGNADETHQQRWMWSFLSASDGPVLGAIAVGSHHDHTRFRLPRSPEVVGLSAVTPSALIAEMGTRFPAFVQAPSFRDWYRAYLKPMTT